jgi:signal peptidase I
MVPTLYPGGLFIASRASYGYSRYSFDAFELPISGRWPALMPRRGDVVVFRLPRDHATAFVKRVVGLPGDQVRMIDGRLWLNDQQVPIEAAGNIPDPSGGSGEVATYIETLPDSTRYRIVKRNGDGGPLGNTPVFIVPPGHIFTLGDNRDNSTDSRDQSPRTGIGYVPIDLVIGRVVLVF